MDALELEILDPPFQTEEDGRLEVGADGVTGDGQSHANAEHTIGLLLAQRSEIRPKRHPMDRARDRSIARLCVTCAPDMRQADEFTGRASMSAPSVSVGVGLSKSGNPESAHA